jgi:CheY-like chemotaxis protein
LNGSSAISKRTGLSPWPDEPYRTMKNILIIEDDPIVAHIYRTRLEKEGYTVEISEDGQSGFYRIHEFHPHGVLLDLMLPKMNGVDILKKIRAQSQFAKIPVIVFTNAYVPNMIQEAQAAGASQVFNKATLTPRQIIDALHLLLGGGSAAGANPVLPLPVQPPGSGHEVSITRLPAPGQTASRAADPSFDAPSQPFFAEGSPPPPRAFVSPDEAARPTPLPMRRPQEPAPGINSDDAAFQAELFRAFNAAKGDTLATIRKSLQSFNKAPDDTSRMPHLMELYRKVHSLTGSAGIAGFSAVSQLTSALEVLLRELQHQRLDAPHCRPVHRFPRRVVQVRRAARRTGQPAQHSGGGRRNPFPPGHHLRSRKGQPEVRERRGSDGRAQAGHRKRLRPDLSRRADAGHGRLRAVYEDSGPGDQQGDADHLRDQPHGLQEPRPLQLERRHRPHRQAVHVHRTHRQGAYPRASQPDIVEAAGGLTAAHLSGMA